MDSSLQAHATQAICRWLHEKYGYSKKEYQAYIKGYEDAASYMDNVYKHRSSHIKQNCRW